MGSFLRKERAAFRQAICGGNEHALVQIRNEPASNAMNKVNAIRTLEALGEGATLRSGGVQIPGVTLRIAHETPQPIDITPRPARIIDG